MHVVSLRTKVFSKHFPSSSVIDWLIRDDMSLIVRRFEARSESGPLMAFGVGPRERKELRVEWEECRYLFCSIYDAAIYEVHSKSTKTEIVFRKIEMKNK